MDTKFRNLSISFCIEAILGIICIIFLPTLPHPGTIPAFFNLLITNSGAYVEALSLSIVTLISIGFTMYSLIRAAGGFFEGDFDDYEDTGRKLIVITIILAIIFSFALLIFCLYESILNIILVAIIILVLVKALFEDKSN